MNSFRWWISASLVTLLTAAATDSVQAQGSSLRIDQASINQFKAEFRAALDARRAAAEAALKTGNCAAYKQHWVNLAPYESDIRRKARESNVSINSADRLELRGYGLKLRSDLRRDDCPPKTAATVPAAAPVAGPRVEVGLVVGGYVFGNGNSTVRGIDDFGGIIRIDQRPLDVSGSSGIVGGVVTVYGPASPLNLFFRTGVLFPINGDVTTTFSGINDVPQVGGTVKVSHDVDVPAFIGIDVPAILFASHPALSGARFQFGAGGVFRNGKITTTLMDEGAGPGSPTYGGTRDFFQFDPGFTGGVRVAVGDILGNGIPVVFGLDTTVTFQSGSTQTFQSPNFPSETVTVRTGGNAVNTSIMASFNVQFSSTDGFENLSPKQSSSGFDQSLVKWRSILTGEFVDPGQRRP